MTFSPQAICLPMMNVWYNAASSDMNNAVVNQYGKISDIYGQLTVASDNSVNNAATTKLFAVKVEFYVTFLHRT